MGTKKHLPLKELETHSKKVDLPDEKTGGDPFWGLMETHDGRLTGSFYVIPELDGKKIPLFFSKASADRFLTARSDLEKSIFVIRGISQDRLKALVFLAESQGISFIVFEVAKGERTEWEYRNASVRDISNQYVSRLR